MFSRRSLCRFFGLAPVACVAAAPASAFPHMRGYIDHFPVPMTLEEAIRQRDYWVETACMFSRNEDYYRGICDQVGEAIGDEAYIADDGSRPGGILRAKLPELVQARLAA